MDEEIKRTVFGLVNTCIEAIKYIEDQWIKNHFASRENMLNQLSEVVKNIQHVLERDNAKGFYGQSIFVLPKYSVCNR